MNNHVIIIAEAGVNHNGDYELAKQLILKAKEAGVEADVVIGVPDSGLGAAMGYANATGIPFAFGIVKNRHLTSSTISPKGKSNYLCQIIQMSHRDCFN